MKLASVPAMLSGVAASAGIATGPAFVCRCDEQGEIPRRFVSEADAPAELMRFDAALAQSYGELLRLEADVRQHAGAGEAEIFAAQRQMLHDPLLRREVATRVRAGQNVEAAVSDATASVAASFARILDPAFAERAADVRDIGRRLLAVLLGQPPTSDHNPPEGSIVVARDLLPSLAANLPRVRGVVAERGGTTAHAVIIARSLGIPTIIGVPGATSRIDAGTPLIVDGLAGRVFVHPGESIRREYRRIESELHAQRHALEACVDLPAVTQEGQAVVLQANVGTVADASAAAAARADGIGLFRTEFAFAVHADFPTEDEHYRTYRHAADPFTGKRVVFRVLDIGSDKVLPYFPLPREPNPSLGRRGTRLLLTHPGILHAQLRAILRLSATHRVAILFPMIGGVDEFRAARAAVNTASAELGQEGAAFDAHVPVGAMIETPSAAVVARALAHEADFLSVGTNDLVQYLLAVDRTSGEVASYYDPLHPAVIQTLRNIADAARAEGKPVSVCGEFAGTPVGTGLLLGLGFTSLSVAPAELPQVRQTVRSLHLATARTLADRAVAASTATEIKALLSPAAPFGGPG